MNHDRLLKYMGFTVLRPRFLLMNQMNVTRNMGMQTCGNIVVRCLIFLLWLPLLMGLCYVCMVD
jgi:hypothetical protein